MENVQNKINKLIDKYKYRITIQEYRMLMTLLRYRLLLDFKEEINEYGIKRLVGYNLERELIYTRIIVKDERK